MHIVRRDGLRGAWGSYSFQSPQLMILPLLVPIHTNSKIDFLRAPISAHSLRQEVYRVCRTGSDGAEHYYRRNSKFER